MGVGQSWKEVNLLSFRGIVLLALAFIFVIYDGMKSIASHKFYATRIEQFWTEVHSRSLQMLRRPSNAAPVSGFGDGWSSLSSISRLR